MRNLTILDRMRSHFGASEEVDAWLLWTLIGLVAVGFLVFLSASIGLLARGGADFGSVATSRIIATCIGTGVAYLASLFHYKNLRRYSLALLLLGIVLNVIVLIP